MSCHYSTWSRFWDLLCSDRCNRRTCVSKATSRSHLECTYSRTVRSSVTMIYWEPGGEVENGINICQVEWTMFGGNSKTFRDCSYSYSFFYRTICNDILPSHGYVKNKLFDLWEKYYRPTTTTVLKEYRLSHWKVREKTNLHFEQQQDGFVLLRLGVSLVRSSLCVSLLPPSLSLSLFLSSQSVAHFLSFSLPWSYRATKHWSCSIQDRGSSSLPDNTQNSI